MVQTGYSQKRTNIECIRDVTEKRAERRGSNYSDNTGLSNNIIPPAWEIIEYIILSRYSGTSRGPFPRRPENFRLILANLSALSACHRSSVILA